MSTDKIQRLFREPLFQFLILGGLIFIADHYFSINRDDPRRIVIDDQKLAELAAIFEEGQGRQPSEKEIDNMIVKWTQNEILFREAQQMGLDRGDDMIRSRMILKMRNVLFNNVVVEAPSDNELKLWFEQHRESYDSPPRYDIEQFHVGDDNSAEKPHTLASQLNSQTQTLAPNYQVRRYAKRPASNIVTLFNEAARADLLEAGTGQWTAVTSQRGWHLARITRTYEAQPANFAEIKNQVIRDWKKYSNDLQLAQQTTAIADRYRIELRVSNAIPSEQDRRDSQNKQSPVGSAKTPSPRVAQE